MSISDRIEDSSQLEEASLYKKFEAFLVKFDKSMDRLRDVRRYHRFKQAYAFISRHNSIDAGKPGTSFRLDLNEWADVLEEELQQMFPASGIPQDSDSASSSAVDAPQTKLILEASGSSLNWAGEDNPLGTSVMSPIKNQVHLCPFQAGVCGE